MGRATALDAFHFTVTAVKLTTNAELVEISCVPSIQAQLADTSREEPKVPDTVTASNSARDEDTDVLLTNSPLKPDPLRVHCTEGRARAGALELSWREGVGSVYPGNTALEVSFQVAVMVAN